MSKARHEGPIVLLHSIADACTSSVAILDDSGTIAYVNQAWTESALPGTLLKTEDGKGITYADACKKQLGIPLNQVALLQKKIDAMLQGKVQTATDQFDRPSPTGTRSVLMRASRIQWPDTQHFGILINHEEVSAPKPDATLNIDEERISQLLRVASIMSWEADAKSWCFTHVSDGAASMFGYPLAEWYEPSFWSSHIHPDDHDYATSLCMEYCEFLDHFEFEYRMMASDGRVVWVHDLVNVVREDGVPSILRGFMIDISERKRTEEALRDLGGRLISAQENERSRVARELHDDLNQRLALLAIELEQLGQKIPRSEKTLRTIVRDLISRTKDISFEVHRLSYELHPSRLQYLGLVPAIKNLCHEMSQHHDIQIDVRTRGPLIALPQDVTLCLFRIVQEAINNVIKHSGAKHARVKVSRTETGVELSVKDEGCGFDDSKQNQGLGLIGMRERLRLVGGEMTIRSQPSQGTLIEVSVPLVRSGKSRKTG